MKLYTLALAMAMTTGAAQAHHSLGATYDLKTEVKLEGRIINVLLRNPHSFLQIEVTDQDGKMQRWSLEWSSANSLAKRGIRAGTLKTGDQITITINPPVKVPAARGSMVALHRGADGLEWSARIKRKQT